MQIKYSRRLSALAFFPTAIVAILASGAAGCYAPQSIVRLSPRAPNVLWVAGRASVQKEDTGVRSAVAFEHQNGALLGVRVEVQNLTATAIDVKPQDFSYVTCGGDAAGTCGPAKPLIDPEGVLASLDMNESREAAGAANDAAFMGPLLLLSVVADVGTIAGGHANHTTGLQTAAISAQMDSSSVRHELASASIGSQRELWSNAALRRNTVPPGGGVSGFVYIPIEPNVGTLWLTVRAGGRVFPFCFRQDVIQVDPLATTTPPGMQQR